MGESRAFLFKLMLQRPFAADMQLHLIAMLAFVDRSDDRGLILLVGEPSDGDDMNESIFELLTLTRRECIRHTIRYDMEDGFVSMLS